MSKIINTKEYNHIFAFKKKHLIVYTAISNSNYYRFVFNHFYINICMSNYVKAMQDDRTRTSPNSSCVLHHNVDTMLSEYHHHYSRVSGNLCVHLAKYAASKAHVFIQLKNCTKKKSTIQVRLNFMSWWRGCMSGSTETGHQHNRVKGRVERRGPHGIYCKVLFWLIPGESSYLPFLGQNKKTKRPIKQASQLFRAPYCSKDHKAFPLGGWALCGTGLT